MSSYYMAGNKSNTYHGAIASPYDDNFKDVEVSNSAQDHYIPPSKTGKFGKR